MLKLHKSGLYIAELAADRLRLLQHVLSLYTTSHTSEEIRLQIIRHADDAAEHCERLAAAAETAITFHGHF